MPPPWAEEERGRSEAESPVDIIRTGNWEGDYLDDARMRIQAPIKMAFMATLFLFLPISNEESEICRVEDERN